MDKRASLGMPMSPQETFKRYKRQSLGMSMHPLFINKSTRSSLNALYFYCFIYYVLFLECLYFCLLFSLVLFCFVLSNKWLDPIILVLEKTHSVLITQNTLVFTFIVPLVFQFASTAFSSWFSILILFRACQFSLFMYDYLSGLY